MCGIAGFWLGSRGNSPHDTISHMTDAIAHRGPDSSGVWSDEGAGVFLGHRRLAIMDLSDAGSQPMTSASGRYTLVYNGEVYNHKSLRKTLADSGINQRWRGGSDTETILACIEAWGLGKTLSALNGMFAFALWDSKARELFLARDRLGEKPLYVGSCGGGVVFASELSALRKFPGFKPEINPEAVALFLTYTNVPSPHCIYKGIYKLQPGCSLCVKSPSDSLTDIQRYWSLSDVVSRGQSSELLVSSAADAKKVLLDQLDKSVSSRMVADVPLGSFLSGGYDSTLVTALMQRHSNARIKTFSIGFNEEAFNEAVYAKAVSENLGTDHTELYIDEKQSLALVPELSNLWDEPFSDSSQIPTYFLSLMARSDVTVALSGDGGDELFGGYSRYQRALNNWRRQSRIPSWLQATGGSSGAWISDILLSTTKAIPVINQSRLVPFLEVSGHALTTLSKANFLDTYMHMLKNWKQADKIVLNAHNTYDILDRAHLSTVTSPVQQMCLIDSLNYLPDTILTKVDRASMAVSLETRAPLLDHELVELATTIDDSLKIRGGCGKWILREITHTLVPEKLVNRPKMGFGVPIESWLRGALRPWAEELLSESKLQRQGIFNPVPIRRMWNEHQTRKWNWHFYLWDVLMFQQWLEIHHPE